MAISIFAPLGYLAFLFVSLYTFSKIYRSRKAARATYEPWFPQHHERDIYVSLLSHDPPPPEHMQVAALLARAMADVKRIWQVRESKAALATMLQKGQIGDELWERFLEAEKELEAEILEVVEEANTFVPGWGQHIFAVASEMMANEKLKETYEGVKKEREEIHSKAASSKDLFDWNAGLSLTPSNPISAEPATKVEKPVVIEPASAPCSEPVPATTQTSDQTTQSQSPTPPAPAPAPAPESATPQVEVTPQANGHDQPENDGEDGEEEDDGEGGSVNGSLAPSSVAGGRAPSSVSDGDGAQEGDANAKGAGSSAGKKKKSGKKGKRKK